MVSTELRVRDPRILRWVEIMAHMGAIRGKVNFGDPFFCWLNYQIPMIKDYAYAGTNFSGDLDLPLPLGV